jgi:hypothetical protein
VTDGEDVRIGADGIVRTRGGRALRPDYVVAPPGLELRGRSLARGTLAGLRLWRTEVPLRVANGRSNAGAIAVACGSARG